MVVQHSFEFLPVVFDWQIVTNLDQHIFAVVSPNEITCENCTCERLQTANKTEKTKAEQKKVSQLKLDVSENCLYAKMNCLFMHTKCVVVRPVWTNATSNDVQHLTGLTDFPMLCAFIPFCVCIFQSIHMKQFIFGEKCQLVFIWKSAIAAHFQAN